MYDPIANPYAPGRRYAATGAGRPRRHHRRRHDRLQRLRSARSAQHLTITGLRGVGKTVLLGKLAAVGEHSGYRVMRIEAVGGDDTILIVAAPVPAGRRGASSTRQQGGPRPALDRLGVADGRSAAAFGVEPGRRPRPTASR